MFCTVGDFIRLKRTGAIYRLIRVNTYEDGKVVSGAGEFLGGVDGPYHMEVGATNWGLMGLHFEPQPSDGWERLSEFQVFVIQTLSEENSSALD